MTVKYIAFDGTVFDTEKKCKNYEKVNGAEIRVEIGNVRSALKKLDDFCNFWGTLSCGNCTNCPLSKLCDVMPKIDDFEKYFNKENPFGNLDYNGITIEED